MPSPPKILIIGASIAGPTAAYFLAKTGASITVIERAPVLRPGGQSIDIRTVGVTVMRKIPGMEAAVRARRAPFTGMCMISAKDGGVVGTMKGTGDTEAQSLVSEFEIFRGDLARVLFELTGGEGKEGEGVRYVFGEQVKSMEHKAGEDGPITVNFANGRLPIAEYDLVVACDGATSRTRAMGFGGTVQENCHPFNVWAAYFSVRKNLIRTKDIGEGYSAPGGRFLAVGPDFDPEVNRVVFMSIQRGEGAEEAMATFREAMKKGDAELKNFISKRFQDAGWMMEEILAGLETSEDLYASEVVQVRMPQVSKGRFVLVGDAGYGPGFTGTGTSLALCGAYLLAGEVGKHPGDLAAGLRGYEERMRPIIKDLQKVPPGVLLFMGPETAWGIWVRNMVFKIITWVMLVGPLFSWLGGFLGNAFGKDTYDLPDYEWVR